MKARLAGNQIHSLWGVFVIILFSSCAVLLRSAHAVDLPHDLAFVAYLGDSWDLFTMPMDGTQASRLTSTPHDEKEPAWSQDRSTIVYATTEGVIRFHEFSSGNERTLDTGKCVSVQPAFAPSGKEIIYVRFSETVPDDTDLYIIDLESERSIPFLGQTSQQFYPACSLDGERLAYINVHCSDSCGRLIQEVWTSDRFGKNARQLVLTSSTCEKPRWSPDGRKLAFSSDMNGNFDIYIYELNSGHLRQVTKDPSLDVSPAWSPDGSKLAFVSTRSGLSEIWIHDFASGIDKKLDPFPGKRVPCKDVAW